MQMDRARFDEAVFLSAVAKEAAKMREREQEVLAEMITEKISAAWNKGQKKNKGGKK